MATTYLPMLDRLQSLLGGSGFRRAYTPYGVLFSGRGSSLAYCGQLRDPSTGNYHLGNGHRTFDPLLMRFHSPDRLSPFGAGGLNAYAYCRGDPVNFSDPDGKMMRRPTQSPDITTNPQSMSNDLAMVAGALVLQDAALLKYMLGTEYYVRQARPHFAAEDYGRLPRTPTAMEYGLAVGSTTLSTAAGISGLVNKWQPEPSPWLTTVIEVLTPLSAYTSGKVTGKLSEWKELFTTAKNISDAVTANGTTAQQIRNGSGARTLEQLQAQDGGEVGRRMDAVRQGSKGRETSVLINPS